MHKTLVIFVTTGTTEEAEKIAEDLIKNRLAACVNIVPGLTSVYRWKGQICKEKEALLIIKTLETLFPQARDLILKIHSYELPEIISWPISAGLEKYLRWIQEECEKKSQSV